MYVNKATIISLISVSALSISGITFIENKEGLNEILHSIFLALLVSSVFYIGTVIVPETQRRKRVRNGLVKQYRPFKKSCIDIFLIASNSQEYKDRGNLLNHQEFRRYFSIKVKGSQTRWDLVATCIDDGDYLFNELVTELEFLMKEVGFVRSSIELYDNDVEDFFNSLVQIIHRIKASVPGSDDYKYFCRTLWDIFSKCRLNEGQREYDIIETMIERI